MERDVVETMRRLREGEQALTLRDYFAAAALTGLVAIEARHAPFSEQRLARSAYALADAMLAARGGK